ncbi:response regulator [Candidatus Margulisiibacteriota bacterium]
MNKPLITRKSKLLIIDDRISIRKAVYFLLKKTFTVIEVDCGEKALEILQGSKIDIAFLDMNMPGINGLETLKRIKESDQNIEVCILTAGLNNKIKAAAKKLGAFGWLEKSIDIPALIETARAMEKVAIENRKIRISKNKITSIKNKLSTQIHLTSEIFK